MNYFIYLYTSFSTIYRYVFGGANRKEAFNDLWAFDFGMFLFYYIFVDLGTEKMSYSTPKQRKENGMK